jgi:protein O-GlcNAc transferase
VSFCNEVIAKDLFAAHRDWHRRFGRLLPISTTYKKRKPERRLKVGYVSPNFREHSVAFFIEPLLREHDHQVVEVHCYAEVMRPDAVTARLQAYSDHWLATVRLSDDDLAKRIRTDGIDILVDLAGHTGDNRLRVFARKPAPVQVTWLGYPNTTGLDAIDYRLVDAVTDPLEKPTFGPVRPWCGWRAGFFAMPDRPTRPTLRHRSRQRPTRPSLRHRSCQRPTR